MAGLGVYSTTRPRGLVMTYDQARTAQIDLPASSNSYILEWNHHGTECHLSVLHSRTCAASHEPSVLFIPSVMVVTRLMISAG